MTRFEKTDLIASVIFRKLPSRDARQAQGSHRLAKEIAVGVMDELERIERSHMTPDVNHNTTEQA